MKKILTYTFVIALFCSMTGCRDWFDINTSPDNPVSVTCEVVLPTLLYFSTQEVFDNAEYGNYLSQCITTTGRSQKADYSYRAGWGGFLDMNRHPHWRRHFYDVGVNAQYLIDNAEKTQKRNYILIANTLLLHSLMITTDEFGEMPLTEAYQSNVPKYDSQKSIYTYLGEQFVELLAKYNDPEWINCPTNGTISIEQDRMFGGDMGKWRAFTKALYARYLIRNIPNRENTPAMRNKIIAAVDAALSDPDWAEPIYKFDGGSGEKNCMWGPYFSSSATMNLGWPQGRDNGLGSAVPTAFFASILGVYNKSMSLNSKITKNPSAAFALDPRAARMMEARMGPNTASYKAIRYLRANIGADVAYGSEYKVEHFPDLFCTTTEPAHTNPYTRNDGYVAFITEEELLFDKAEAQYWNGNKADAYNTTCDAVERSFQRYTVRGNLGESEEQLIDLFYRMRLEASTFSIAELMQQKYVALFLQPEQWCDIRRYNYSSSSNGIMYDGKYVYVVENAFDGKSNGSISDTRFTGTFPLVRPYNLYTAHFMTDRDFGTNFTLSANAWINRMCPDPETEDKYNRAQMEAIGAYKNSNYLRCHMIWQMPTNDGGALTNRGDGVWIDINNVPAQ